MLPSFLRIVNIHLPAQLLFVATLLAKISCEMGNIFVFFATLLLPCNY